MDEGSYIGISIGTTSICVAYYGGETAQTQTVTDKDGNHRIPTYISFENSEERTLFGYEAFYSAGRKPENTIFELKRIIGKNYSELEEEIKNWPFKVKDEDGEPIIQVFYRGQVQNFSAIELTSFILQHIKELIQQKIQKKVYNCVLTVPIYFSGSQRQQTKVAGSMAGLNILRIINEPVAALLGYGLEKNTKTEKYFLCFHLGGRTTSVDLILIDDGIFELVSNSCDLNLGGIDFDRRLVQYLSSQFLERNNVDISNNVRAQSRLNFAAEGVKIRLSSNIETQMEVDQLYDSIDFDLTITRELFENLNNDLFEKAVSYIQTVLKDGRKEKDQIDGIVLTGRSTRIPRIQSLISILFNGKKLNDTNPDIVAHGAAIQAWNLARPQTEDILPILLG